MLSHDNGCGRLPLSQLTTRVLIHERVRGTCRVPILLQEGGARRLRDVQEGVACIPDGVPEQSRHVAPPPMPRHLHSNTNDTPCVVMVEQGYGATKDTL